MRALRLVVDGRPLVGQRTGIGVHTAEIASRLSFDPPPLIASHATIEDRTGIEALRFQVDPTPLGVLWQQLQLPRIDADVVWGPHGTLPVSLRTPAVVTLHDFTSLTMPRQHTLKTILSFNLFIGRSLQLARRIAAVSKQTAEEAVRGFGVPRNRIEIVPNGVDAFFSPGGAREDFILYCGTLEPRKGIDDLLAVWESLPDPRPPLVLCGGSGWGPRVAAAALGRRGITVTGYVDRERLRELYRRARVFVYPSHYEGFGIPPLEALACGAPVIATRTGAIPEYAADAALLVDPGDRASFRSGLRASLLRLLHDAPLREELSQRGAERATHYRWERSASLMEELLIEAAR